MAERARENLRAEGFTDRCEVVGGCFFDRVPKGALARHFELPLGERRSWSLYLAAKASDGSARHDDGPSSFYQHANDLGLREGAAP